MQFKGKLCSCFISANRFQSYGQQEISRHEIDAFTGVINFCSDSRKRTVFIWLSSTTNLFKTVCSVFLAAPGPRSKLAFNCQCCYRFITWMSQTLAEVSAVQQSLLLVLNNVYVKDNSTLHAM